MTTTAQFHLDKMIAIAAENNAQLISKIWRGGHNFYAFSLHDGTLVSLRYYTIFADGWNPNPARSREPRYEKLLAIAGENGGKVVSSEWLGLKNIHVFEFSDGCQFEMFAYQMLNEDKHHGWPQNPDLYLSMKDSRLYPLKVMALENEGDVISTQWLGQLVKHQFVLSNGQVIESTPVSIIKGRWPTGKNHQTPEMLLDRIRKIAEAHNGQLISKKWMGARTQHCFAFEDGEQFWRTPDNMLVDIKKGRSGWPVDQAAYMKTDEHHLDQLRQMALSRGGKLLSTIWIGNEELYDFEDAAGVKFKARAHNVKAGSWSADAGLVTEPLFRQIMEHFFGAEFPKTKQILTTTVTGGAGAWELDGYCESLKIAFEYQGFQSHWDSDYPSYEKTSARDAEKIRICTAMGILLVVIPCIPLGGVMWGIKKMIQHLKDALQSASERTGWQLPAINESEFIPDLTELHRCVFQLKRMETIAKANGGELLSTSWLGSSATYDFQKSDGTLFSRSASNFHTYGWPQKPQPKDKSEFMEEMRGIAAKNGGTLVSPEWLGARIRHTFAFADGHTFEMTLNQLKMQTGGWPKENGRYLYRNGQSPQKEKDIPQFSRK